MNDWTGDPPRRCFREPIPEIFIAADMLELAVRCHNLGDTSRAAGLFRLADMSAIREWTESIWGSSAKDVSRFRAVPDAPAPLAKVDRIPVRMPNAAEKKLLIERDGMHCRFCGIPVIRSEVRARITSAYPIEAYWGGGNRSQHAALQAMWLQYDHVLPHARGGDNRLGNVLITCAPCNYGRGSWLLDEVGILDPLRGDPVCDAWSGLEGFRP